MNYEQFENEIKQGILIQTQKTKKEIINDFIKEIEALNINKKYTCYRIFPKGVFPYSTIKHYDDKNISSSHIKYKSDYNQYVYELLTLLAEQKINIEKVYDLLLENIIDSMLSELFIQVYDEEKYMNQFESDLKSILFEKINIRITQRYFFFVNFKDKEIEQLFTLENLKEKFIEKIIFFFNEYRFFIIS